VVLRWLATLREWAKAPSPGRRAAGVGARRPDFRISNWPSV